jgi:hypothetical protein
VTWLLTRLLLQLLQLLKKTPYLSLGVGGGKVERLGGGGGVKQGWAHLTQNIIRISASTNGGSSLLGLRLLNPGEMSGKGGLIRLEKISDQFFCHLKHFSFFF